MDAKTIRKELHQIPELGRKEYKTKQYLIDILRKLDCRVETPTPTGVVAFFDCQLDKTICFRADMDALPIEEKTGLSFASMHAGISHACGHDGHMAMLLEYSIWASEHKSELKSNIVCLFQPSEEDDAGASDILKSGILDQFKVEEIYGLHLWPKLEENKLYTMPYGMLATSGELNIDFYGKTVHAANRKEGIDALLIASFFIQKFYEMCRKLKSPHLISFGHLTAGTVRNSVAGTAHLEGTMRAFDDETFQEMKDMLMELVQVCMDNSGARIEVSLNAAYPSVINDPVLVQKHQSLLNYSILEQPFLQAEDFGCYTRKFKALFMLLGCGDTHLLHTPQFDFNMDILKTGVEVFKKLSLS